MRKMVSVVIDEALRSRLGGLKQQVAFLDESGQVLGHFVPAVEAHPEDGCPYTPEELARFQKETGGRPLRAIWQSLGQS
jgi:hypothetical protein